MKFVHGLCLFHTFPCQNTTVKNLLLWLSLFMITAKIITDLSKKNVGRGWVWVWPKEEVIDFFVKDPDHIVVTKKFLNLQRSHCQYIFIDFSFLVDITVRHLKFARNLKFATSKTLVNFMKKMMFCLRIGIFQFKKP